MSKTVIYRYFSDKDELIDAVLERISDGGPAAAAAGRAGRRAHRRPCPAARGHRRVRLADRGRAGALPLRLRPRRPLGPGRPGGRHRARDRRGAGPAAWPSGSPTPGRPTDGGDDVGLRRRRHGPARRALVVGRPAPVPAADLVDQLTDLAYGGLRRLLPPPRSERRPMSEHEEPEGYDGEVTVAVDGEAPRTARAALAARFDPLAGHVVWSGRVATDWPRGRRSSSRRPTAARGPRPPSATSGATPGSLGSTGRRSRWSCWTRCSPTSPPVDAATVSTCSRKTSGRL